MTSTEPTTPTLDVPAFKQLLERRFQAVVHDIEEAKAQQAFCQEQYRIASVLLHELEEYYTVIEYTVGQFYQLYPETPDAT